MLSRLQRVTIPLRSTVLRCYGSTSKSSSASTADKSEMDRFTSATGAPTSNDIPTELEHAVGIERLEILANLQGQHAFLDQPLQVKAKGTMKAPVLVESMLDERIVGCSGKKITIFIFISLFY